MFSPYGRVLRLPGALAFSLSGFVARMPMSMVSLGIVLLISSRTGSYSLAGAVSASFLVANAAFAIVQARLIDRLGQGRVLLSAALLFGAGLVAMMWCVERGAATPWPHLCAAVAGATMPQIGSSVRSRWSHLVEDKRDLHTAFALESVVDETIFIVGPALVTGLATVIHPVAGLTCAVVATVLGTTLLVGQTRSEPPVTERATHDAGGPLPWGLLAPLLACAFTMGALLGGAEVATVAFCEELQAKAAAGLLLAIWAIGSLISGVLTGAVQREASNPTRFRWGMRALGVLMLPLPFVDGFLALGIFLFLSGFAISPTLIAGFGWIEETVPAGRVTEGITLFTTALGAGLAPGAALVGVLVDDIGASTSFWVPAVAGILGAAIAMLVSKRSARRRVVARAS